MFATIVNCISVIVGGLLGLFLGKRIKEQYREVVFNGAGVTTVVIGLSMAFKSGNPIFLALALIAGGIVGTRLDIEGAILRLGVVLERLTTRRRPALAIDADGRASPAEEKPARESARAGWDFGHGFLNASVLFCVGAMALVGSFQAGTEGDYSLILTKSVLDGFMAILMTAALGPGVIFSALPILFYQGALTLGAGFLKPYVSDFLLAELTGIGGALVVMIGFNLLAIKKIKTADFLPGLVFTVLLVLSNPYFCLIAEYFGV